MIDYIAKLPQIMSQACTVESIMTGFKANGMIDDSAFRYLDWRKLLGTCKRKITDDEYELCKKTFPILLEYFLEHGHIPDSIFYELGYPKDLDPDGNEVQRLAGIEAESRQRCKELTHDFQIQLRRKRKEAIEAKLSEKRADKQIKKNNALALNRECEDRLPEDDLEDATLEDFAACNVPQLKHFIYVRAPNDVVRSKLPNKGSLEDAKEGVQNLILMAYEIRNENIELEAEDDTEETNNEEDVPIFQPTVEPVRLKESKFVCEESASTLLHDMQFIYQVEQAFLPKRRELLETDLDMFENADRLQTLLLQRLHLHVKDRLPNIRENKDWPFHWTAHNIARIAAIMCLMGHVKEDLSCLGMGKTLLKYSKLDGEPHHYNFVNALCPPNSLREGAYLYYDRNDGIFIRSGKVSGRDFMTRHIEHKSASEQGVSSNFYRRYPTKAASALLTSQGIGSRGRKGYFDHLMMFVGLGYDPQQPNIDNLLSSIFLWPVDVNERIERLSFNSGGNTISSALKRRHMVSYLAEMGYDLSICTTDNVSTSGGYEATGLWKRN